MLTVGDRLPAFELTACVSLERDEAFADRRDGRILGFSGDSEFVHHAWRKDHDDLRDLCLSMPTDSKHELMRDPGIRGEDTLGPVKLPAGE